MQLSARQKEALIAAGEKEYGLRLLGLNFPDSATLQTASRQRQQLLAELEQLASIGCRGTKLDMRRLSPGCRICTEGSWSCLFISGKCNCSCFYCPTAQPEIGLPTTNTLEFPEPSAYVHYLERFGFRGASISGGEPLLTPERSLAFVRAIKKHFGTAMHVWLYTNGTLAHPELLAALGDAGLDEIRFDIGATNYQLARLGQAVGVIPTVTVEIPAIPEDAGKLIALLPQLRDTGVQHLNLHQLRLTPYNYDKLQPRDYRYLHGEKITVLDSELAALTILLHSLRQRTGIPVNYCSFPYKNRFQGQATRTRNASFLVRPWESITANGFIRQMDCTGSAPLLAECARICTPLSTPPELWQLDLEQRLLRLHPSLWPPLSQQGLGLRLTYQAVYQRQKVSGRSPHTAIELDDQHTVFLEKDPHQAVFSLNEEEARLFGEVFLTGTQSLNSLPVSQQWEEISAFEEIREGLAEYF